MILLEREKQLSELEQKIGYCFRSRALLDRALTHRSFANERVEEKRQHNEALEFLGDAVLGLIVSSWLLERFPDISEGKLSKMKAYLVSESSLVELAEVIDLGRYILLNRGEEKTGGRRKRALLADAYEALIGVIYIDAGIETVQRFLRRELRDRVMSIDPSSMIGADYKSALQEQLQANGAPVPEYVVVEALGPDHRRTFRVELRVAGRALATGEGRTIKLAQQEAAGVALSVPNLIDEITSEHSRGAQTEGPGDYLAGSGASSAEICRIDGETIQIPTMEEWANGDPTQTNPVTQFSNSPSIASATRSSEFESEGVAESSEEAETKSDAHEVATQDA